MQTIFFDCKFDHIGNFRIQNNISSPINLIGTENFADQFTLINQNIHADRFSIYSYLVLTEFG